MISKKLMSAIVAIALLLSLAVCSVSNAEESLGGWEFNLGKWTREENTGAKSAFNKATGDLLGVDYKLIACVARQVVQGTNYCFLCKATPVIPNGKATEALIYVYEDLDGHAKVDNIKDVSVKRTTCGLKVRRGPAKSYGIVTTLKAGRSVRVYGIIDGWAMVKCGKVKGWVNSRYLR